MSKKSAKLAALLVCGTMLAGSFAGCQSPSKASSSAESSKSGASASGSKLSDTLVTITAMRDENAAQPIKTDTVVLQYLEKELNIKLEIEAVPKANYEDKKKLKITTNNLPDISLVGKQDLIDYAKSGVFVNLSENMDKMPNFKKLIEGPYSDLQKLKVNGSFYGTPILCRWQPRAGATALIRVDLLEKNNIPVPKTFDEFFSALQTLKQKYPDKIPFTNRKGGSVSGTEKILECMSYPLGSVFNSNLYPVYDDDKGKYVVGPATEEFKAVLSYLNKMYKAGLLDPDYATNTSDQWKEKMSSGKALATFDNAGFGQDFNIALSQKEPDSLLLPIYSMTNSFGKTRNTFYDKNWPSNAYAISAKSKNVDVAIKLLDWYYSEKGCDVTGFGVEGETFDYVNGKPTMKTSVMEKYLNENSPSYAIQSALGIGYLCLTPYVDTGAEVQMKNFSSKNSNPSVAKFIEAYNSIEKDPNMREPVLDPPFTPEESQRIKEIVSVLQNMFKPEYDKYIIGVTPMTEYDKLIAKARAAGAEELEKIYNDANARVKK